MVAALLDKNRSSFDDVHSEALSLRQATSHREAGGITAYDNVVISCFAWGAKEGTMEC